MPIGPGKYDDVCTQVRKQTHAEGVLLAVFQGEHGNGFSLQASVDVVTQLPQILRDMADEIERSGP